MMFWFNIGQALDFSLYRVIILSDNYQLWLPISTFYHFNIVHSAECPPVQPSRGWKWHTVLLDKLKALYYKKSKWLAQQLTVSLAFLMYSASLSSPSALKGGECLLL